MDLSLLSVQHYSMCQRESGEKKRGTYDRADVSMSRRLLLIRYCACGLVWVLLSKFLISCLTLFSDPTNCNTENLLDKTQARRLPCSFTQRILILSLLTAVKQRSRYLYLHCQSLHSPPPRPPS